MTRSPRRLREQVKDTVSELPIHAARLAVMGVGRALLLTDRVRKDYREARQSGLGPVLGRLKGDASAITGIVVGKVSGNGKDEGTRAGDADSEISVGKPKPAARRPATPPTRPPAAKPTTPKPATKPVSKPAEKPDQKPAAKPAPKPAPKPTAKPTAKPAVSKTSAEPAAKPKPGKPASKPKPAASTGTPAAGLPLADYDKASLASVRARLRNLDAKQVAALRDHERAHAARADFLRMYENRIAKLRDER